MINLSCNFKDQFSKNELLLSMKINESKNLTKRLSINVDSVKEAHVFEQACAMFV